MLYVLNLGEERGRPSCTNAKQEYREGPLAGRTHTAVTAVCGKIEAELAELPARGAAASIWPATGLRNPAWSA